MSELPTEVRSPTVREIQAAHVGLAIVPVWIDARPWRGLAQEIDFLMGGRLQRYIRRGGCQPQTGQKMLLCSKMRLGVERVVLVGCGELASRELATDSFIEVASRLPAELGESEVAIELPGRFEAQLSQSDAGAIWGRLRERAGAVVRRYVWLDLGREPDSRVAEAAIA